MLRQSTARQQLHPPETQGNQALLPLGNQPPINTPTVRGHVERYLFERPDGEYSVALVNIGTDMITAVGTFAGVSVGDSVVISGRWVDSPRFGRQLKAESVVPALPTTVAGVERWLVQAKIPSIGPATAAKIVARFGLGVLAILDDAPERLLEVPGIGRRKLPEIVDVLRAKRRDREVAVFLAAHGVPGPIGARIVAAYGDDAIQVLRERPYSLIEDIRGVGFGLADTIARGVGVAHAGPDRVRAGLVHVLTEAAKQGSTCLPRQDLVDEADKLLGVPSGAVLDTLLDGPLVEDGLVYLRHQYRAEQRVARALSALSGSMPVTDDPAAAVREAERRLGIRLDDGQRAALALGLGAGLMVLTGGPGTGKTTIIKALLSLAQEYRLTVELAAPTGRAAKKMSEATGHPARTIHRLLEYSRIAKGFARNRDNPLDCRLLVIDEASMLDTWLADQLLAAVPPGCRVWFVGDVDQLPSVGAGRVLADLIDSGVCPVGRLTHIHRQAQGSAIVTGSHQVKNGQVPTLGADLRLIRRDDPERVVHGILAAILSTAKEAGIEAADVQVLVPMRKGDLGTVRLNRRLQAVLNPPGPPELQRGETFWRVGDRVMQTANDYDLDVFNGDLGRIVGLDREAKRLRVDFDGRVLDIEGEALENLEHAWACTIHKSQGSEYPAVVIALAAQHWVMLRRNLLYTAITRGKRLVVIVGTDQAIKIAVGRTDGDRRWTGLREKLEAERGGLFGK